MTVYCADEILAGDHDLEILRSVRVLVCDARAFARESLRQTLAASRGFVVCGEARDAVEAVAAAVETLPDVCLVDVALPGSGIAAIWEISARLPATKIVALAESASDGDLFAAIRAGVAGYLLKDSDSRLIEALNEVLEGRAAVSSSLVARLMAEFRDSGARRRIPIVADDPQRVSGQLTSREWQVLDLMRHDCTTAEMAGRLVVSKATIRTHVAAILHKLDLPNRQAATHWLQAGS